jgi:hypothetical protein
MVGKLKLNYPVLLESTPPKRHNTLAVDPIDRR